MPTWFVWFKSCALTAPEAVPMLTDPTPIDAAVIANRVSGMVNAPSLIQLAIEKCVDEKCNVDYYERNGRTLYEALTSMGFECIEPQGAFYLWMKSPVENEKEFVAEAKKHNILFVPGSSFAGPGYVRLSYCVSYEQIERSIPAFRVYMSFSARKSVRLGSSLLSS